ncbi:MAG: hypothetical protein ATN35_12740 [Epulopiscium sp. Nele67-Bin004]|nr:MAG: hypothetical protein ATN35_12740 [Epulopiscium sp. Nele67-Bin004]
MAILATDASDRKLSLKFLKSSGATKTVSISGVNELFGAGARLDYSEAGTFQDLYNDNTYQPTKALVEAILNTFNDGDGEELTASTASDAYVYSETHIQKLDLTAA